MKMVNSEIPWYCKTMNEAFLEIKQSEKGRVTRMKMVRFVAFNK